MVDSDLGRGSVQWWSWIVGCFENIGCVDRLLLWNNFVQSVDPAKVPGPARMERWPKYLAVVMSWNLGFRLD